MGGAYGTQEKKRKQIILVRKPESDTLEEAEAKGRRKVRILKKQEMWDRRSLVVGFCIQPNEPHSTT